MKHLNSSLLLRYEVLSVQESIEYRLFVIV